MRKATYDLALRDSLFDPNDPFSLHEKKASYKKYKVFESTLLYKVWVFLEGADLPFVESVRYHLHPTFPNPVQLVERSMKNPRCALVIFAWGMFSVKAEVRLVGGDTLLLSHFLTFGDEIVSHDKNIQWEGITSGSLQTR